MATWTWNFEDWYEADDTPSSQIVFEALFCARRYAVKQIHFEKFSQPEVDPAKCSVSFIKRAVARKWRSYRGSFGRISSLARKVLAQMKTGRIALRISSDDELAVFDLTTNPNPHANTKVTLADQGR